MKVILIRVIIIKKNNYYYIEKSEMNQLFLNNISLQMTWICSIRWRLNVCVLFSIEKCSCSRLFCVKN